MTKPPTVPANDDTLVKVIYDLQSVKSPCAAQAIVLLRQMATHIIVLENLLASDGASPEEVQAAIAAAYLRRQPH